MRLSPTITSFSLAAAVAFGSLTPSAGVVPETAERPAVPAAVPTVESAELGSRVVGAELDEALAEYVTAGLPAPVAEVYRFSTDKPCFGNFGYHLSRDGRSEVRLCNDNPNTLAHELAHAWIAQHTTGAQRNEFMSLRGFESWNDQNVDWHDRGTEDAAFVLQAVLRTEQIPAGSPEWQSRLEAFALLTEVQSEAHSASR